MGITVIGEHPLAHDQHGHMKCRIGTLFLDRGVLVTIPGTHAFQRIHYIEMLNEERRSAGRPNLSEEELFAMMDRSVDLIMDDGTIEIRPDSENLCAAFEADEMLQGMVSKRQIKFLHVMNETVRQAIKQRGECWRITALPQTPDQITTMLERSRIYLGGAAMYYYNRLTGTRYLTCHEFAQLATLDPDTLAHQLREIQVFSSQKNRLRYPEVDFFLANGSFGRKDFEGHDFLQSDPAAVVRLYRDLARRFQQAVKPELQEDDLDNPEWRRRMLLALIGERNATVAEEILQGLSPEFFLQIEWVPGARIEDGELIFDTIFDELKKNPDDEKLRELCDERAKGFIFNFIREFGDVEYVNVGRVNNSLSLRPKMPGRRRVYIAEIKLAGQERVVVRIIRIQKWGIYEHLEDGKDLLQAILNAEEYTDYILDRRLGCRQLGMNLPPRINTRKVSERYSGSRPELAGQTIWSTYFDRDYIGGVATDKVPLARFGNPEFALRFARLLGRSAATNVVVGRLHLDGAVLFDDGDDVVVEDAEGLPREMVVADHTGTFADYTSALDSFAAAYAKPVNRRIRHMSNPREFAEAYVGSFVERFLHVQGEYRKRRRAFDTLFQHRRRDVLGSFAYRWEKVLERLDRTDAAQLGEAIRRHIELPAAPPAT